ncbi:UNVERIFIED_CONTAM: Retrovirus-related Pol polyprotein from transposon RE2 [Sesamum indicum]
MCHDRVCHDPKAYKLYDLENSSTFTWRDVQFYENQFPYANSQTTSTSYPLPVVAPHADLLISDPRSPPPTTSSTPVNRFPTHTSPAIPMRPSWLNNFICNARSSSCSLSANPAYMSFVALLSVLQEPRSFSEAVEHQEWRDAMRSELEALEKNSIWHRSLYPRESFTEVEGIDYVDSFSPVPKTVTVRLFLAIAAARGWPLQQLDINNAFLHGHLEEDMYMTPPEGYDMEPHLTETGLSTVECGIHSSTHCLWFHQSAHDHCLFVKDTPSGPMVLLVFVDDILITGPLLAAFRGVKDYLHTLFTIKDIGDARYFLGMEIARCSDGLYVSRTKYTIDIIRDAGLCQAKSASTPLPQGLRLHSTLDDPLPNRDSYRRLVGRLLYLAFTRPNISHPVQQLSQFLTNHCDSHWRAALHVVRYLKVLKAFYDADWATCPDSCIRLQTKKQPTISRSTVEAEYRSLAAAVCELRWVSYIQTDLGVSTSLPIELLYDSKASLHILVDPVFHKRTKHIELDCHLLADLFTKVLPLSSFNILLSKLELTSRRNRPKIASDEVATSPASRNEVPHQVANLEVAAPSTHS